MPSVLISTVHVSFLAVLLSEIASCWMGLHLWQDPWVVQDHQSWIILGVAKFSKWVNVRRVPQTLGTTHILCQLLVSSKQQEKCPSASTELGLTSPAVWHQTSPNPQPRARAHMHVCIVHTCVSVNITVFLLMKRLLYKRIRVPYPHLTLTALLKPPL